MTRSKVAAELFLRMLRLDHSQLAVTHITWLAPQVSLDRRTTTSRAMHFPHLSLTVHDPHVPCISNLPNPPYFLSRGLRTLQPNAPYLWSCDLRPPSQ